MSGYRVVDLRGEIAPARSSWGNSSKGAGVVLHYNGGPVPARAWNKPIQWIRFINDLHEQPGRFAPGWRINGIAYCEWIIGDTVYRLRNWAADLPHCGNLYWNRNSLGLHIPIGSNQRPQDAGKGTMLTALRRADDHLKAMGRPRSALKGHREVGSSLCPGDPIMASINNYRQGADVQPDGGNPPKADNSPVQSGVVYRVIAGSFSHRSNANDRARQLVSKGFPEPWIYQHGQYFRVQSASYSDEGNADEMVQKLKAAGIEAYALAEKS